MAIVVQRIPAKVSAKILDEIHAFCVKEFDPLFLCSIYPPYPSRVQLDEFAAAGGLWLARDSVTTAPVGLIVTIDTKTTQREIIYSVCKNAKTQWGAFTTALLAQAKAQGVILHADPKRAAVRAASIAAGMVVNADGVLTTDPAGVQ